MIEFDIYHYQRSKTNFFTHYSYMRIAPATLSLFVLLLAACNAPTARLDTYEVHGIDVSHYQGRIDWTQIAAQDIHFAYIKASEGEWLQDSMFCTNWEAAKLVGIKRGAYHFYRPNVDVRKQISNFIGAVEMEYGDLPPVLDIEVLDGVATPDLLPNLTYWLNIMELHYGMKPVIYTNLKFYNKHLAGSFAEYPTWIARYNDKEPRLACGTAWQFWQYGNRGRLQGIEGDVDFNIFVGTRQELDELGHVAAVVFSDWNLAEVLY